MRIKELREARGILQKDMAQDLSLGLSTLSQYETGKREPDFETLKRIADYLQVSTDYLLGRDSPSSDPAPPKKYEGPMEYAAFGGLSDLTPKEKEDMETFLRFLIARREKELEDKNP